MSQIQTTSNVEHVQAVPQPVEFRNSLITPSTNLIKLHKENSELFRNNPLKTLEVNNQTWSMLDSLLPYDFDLCRRRYAREIDANPRLAMLGTGMVPFSVFLKNSILYVILFYKFDGGKPPNVGTYNPWFKDYTWKYRWVTDGHGWTTCSTIKGTSGKGDGRNFSLILTCPAPIASDGPITLSVWKSEQDQKPFLEMENLLVCNEDNQPFRTVSLAVCTQVSDNQIVRLPEWLEYHQQLGFELFYLYLDSPNIDIYHKLLETFMKRHPGLVVFVPFYFESNRRAQLASMHDCVWRLKGVADFVALFDVDEFFQLMDKTSQDLLTFVKRKLPKDGENAAFYTPSISFSTIDDTVPDGFTLVTDTFTIRMPKPLGSRWYKGILITNRINYVEIHKLASGEKWIDVDYSSELRLNHYRVPHHSQAWKGELAIEDLSFSQQFSNNIKTELRRSNIFIVDSG